MSPQTSRSAGALCRRLARAVSRPAWSSTARGPSCASGRRLQRQRPRDDNKGKLVATRIEGQYGDGDAYQTYGEVDGLTLAVGVDGWMNDETALKSSGYGDGDPVPGSGGDG